MKKLPEHEIYEKKGEMDKMIKENNLTFEEIKQNLAAMRIEINQSEMN